jgi:hypothetical protein
MDFAAGVYLSEAQNPILNPLPLHTLYVYTVYLFTQGEGGGGVEPERRGPEEHRRVHIPKLGWKYQQD